jgi:hypothetical protein
MLKKLQKLLGIKTREEIQEEAQKALADSPQFVLKIYYVNNSTPVNISLVKTLSFYGRRYQVINPGLYGGVNYDNNYVNFHLGNGEGLSIKTHLVDKYEILKVK